MSALHPGATRYLSAGQLDTGFARLRGQFDSATSLVDAYLHLSRFLATLRCGHTCANFYNQKRRVSEALFAGRTRLPVHFRWLGERMIIVRNLSDEPRLAAGGEIHTVNGQPAAALLRELLPCVPADGHNDAKRRALLSVQGRQGIETFDVFQGLLRAPRREVHRLRVNAPGDRRVHTVEVRAQDLAERREHRAAHAAGDQPAWTLVWPREDSALITMPTWALYDSAWNWQDFLASAFTDIRARRARHLVLDLRGNEGGLDECGHALLSHLVSSDLTSDAFERRVMYRRVPDELDAHLDTWDDSFRDWSDAAVPSADGGFRLAPADAAVIAPREPGFRGRVSVLIDSDNSSATFTFAQTVQSRHLGALVGEPTGGNRRGINGGAFFFLRLPRSELEVDLPLIGYFPTRPQPDEGLRPDVLVIPTVEDIRDGKDRALAVALDQERVSARSQPAPR